MKPLTFEEFPELREVFLEEFEKHLKSLRRTYKKIVLEKDVDLNRDLFKSLEGLKDTFSFVELYEHSKLVQRWIKIFTKLSQKKPSNSTPFLSEFKKVMQFLELTLNAIENNRPLPPVKELLVEAENNESSIFSEAFESNKEESLKGSVQDTTTEINTNSSDFSEFITNDIIENFVEETTEILENLNSQLLELENNPTDQELINSVFRGFHSIKGNCGFIGFKELETLAHALEDVLNKIRSGKLQLTPDLNDIFLSSLDVIQQMLKDYKNKKPIRGEWQKIVENSQRLLNSLISSVETQTPQPFIKNVDLENSNCNFSENFSLNEETIRINVHRLDTLMNLVGELVLVRNRMNQLLLESDQMQGAVSNLDELRDVGDQFNFLITEIQNTVMQTRLVPISRVFNKFPRLVRDLARQAGKKVKVILNGENTEVDKSVIDVIGDPLMHIIRNAIDHGIEKPEERKKVGKPIEGTIELSARHDGNNIVIIIRDDGRGIDTDKILQTALDKKLITQEQVQSLRKPDILNFIFLPGFSTARQVTAISGRGVGMDVVKSNITRLNGFVELDSERGKGTTFTLRFPLTMAIVQGLLVGVDEEIYVVPVSAVLETLRGMDIPLKKVHGFPTTIVRERVIPLLDLQEILLQQSRGNGMPGLENTFSKKYVVLVGHAEKQIGLVVDRLIGEEEVVIKPLGSVLEKIPGISGATILGDGRVRLILDVGGLIRIGNLQNVGA